MLETTYNNKRIWITGYVVYLATMASDTPFTMPVMVLWSTWKSLTGCGNFSQWPFTVKWWPTWVLVHEHIGSCCPTSSDGATIAEALPCACSWWNRLVIPSPIPSSDWHSCRTITPPDPGAHPVLAPTSLCALVSSSEKYRCGYSTHLLLQFHLEGVFVL